jgi:hypothetical protein
LGSSHEQTVTAEREARIAAHDARVESVMRQKAEEVLGNLNAYRGLKRFEDSDITTLVAAFKWAQVQ